MLRVQFTPIMIAPVVLGAAAAWHYARAFVPLYFLLSLVGAFCLHLAANGIDDVYDYVNGTDKVTERMFPPETPGWKPIARGIVSVGFASRVSYLLYGVSLAIGIALSLLVGWLVLAIAVPGILLSYFYTAPPLKLDYRGLGLGEASVLLSFGPIPALGVYYVMAGALSPLPFLVAIPSGLLTTSILVSHDLIFYDAYKESGKRSITVVVGRKAASLLSTILSAAAYVLLVALFAASILPAYSLLALFTLPIFVSVADFGRKEKSPAEYGSRTTKAFVLSTAFTFLLAVGLVLGTA